MPQENPAFARNADVLSLIRGFVNNPSYKTYKELASGALPADIAEALKALSAEDARRLMTTLPNELSADVFQELDVPLQLELFDVMGSDKAADILSEMESDDAADLISELDKEDAQDILSKLDEDADDVKDLLKYEEDSSGGIMATEFVALNVNWDVNRAFEELRALAPDADKAYYVYVTDDWDHLVGVLSLRDLVMADRTDIISDLMNRNVLSVKADSDQEDAAHIFKKYGFLSLPVVDDQNKLTGIISANDIIHVLEEETTEDIHKMSATLPLEDTYLGTSIFELWAKRVVWLLALFITGAFTSGIMKNNEALLARFVTLIFFVPMLIDEGGNAGSQASAIMIRALALREFELSDYMKVLWKELKVSLLLGLVIGSLGFAAAALMPAEALVWSQSGMIVGFSTFLVVLFGSVAGAALPLGAHLIGFDPAVLSGPLVTTLVDSVGLLIYFFMTKMVLGI